MINSRGLASNASITDIISLLSDMLRRSIDGTVVPLFVDSTNQRVIVGSTVSSGNNSLIQVNGGDIETITAGKGIIIKDDGGSGHSVRVTATWDASTNNWTLNLTGIS